MTATPLPAAARSTRYTPGPWRMSQCQCGHPSCRRLQPGPGMFPMGAGYDPADAQLIVAAPDMHEALELADALLSGANMNRKVVERKVREALAKVRGAA